MNAWDWYLDAWHNFGNFEGRSSRPAFWYFTLVNVIVVFMCLFIDFNVFGDPILSVMYGLATVIPGLSLGVRRLHDAGYSGWVILVGVIPYIGQLVLLLFLVCASESDPNQYGPNPNNDLADRTGATGVSPSKPKAGGENSRPPTSVKIAIAVAMADGALADSEGETIKRWIIRSLEPYHYQNEERERLKRLYNDAFKEAYVEARTGKLILSELCDRLNEIGERKVKVDAVGLCFDVMTADGVIDAGKTEVINTVAAALGLDKKTLELIRDGALAGKDLRQSIS